MPQVVRPWLADLPTSPSAKRAGVPGLAGRRNDLLWKRPVEVREAAVGKWRMPRSAGADVGTGPRSGRTY